MKASIKSWIDKKRVSIAEWLAPSVKADAYKKGYAEGQAEGVTVGFEKGHYEAYREMHINLRIFHMIEEAQCYVKNILDKEAAVHNLKDKVANVGVDEADEIVKEVAKSMVHL